MAQLSESRAAGQTGHIADTNALHRKANYVFDVLDYGAIGDGVADDTAALDAAVVAADAANRGTVFLPIGTYITTGLALTGTGVNILGQGPTSILKGKSGITGAVLDLNGYDVVSSNFGTPFFNHFNIEGDGLIDAGATHYGIDTSGASGISMEGISIKDTGGPGWYSDGAQWGCTFRNITLGRPIDADTNDVPYAYFRGWMNGDLFQQIGFRSTTTDPDGSSVWLIEDDGTTTGHDSSIKACWVEFAHTPENGAVWDFSTNGYNVECPQMFDSSTTSDNQTGSCVLRFRPAVNGAGDNAGGNYIWGQIPGDGKALRSHPYGVEVLQDRNFISGVRGFDGRNVHIATGIEFTSVLMGGRLSGSSVTSPESVINDSVEDNNTIMDLAMGRIALSIGGKIERHPTIDTVIQIGTDLVAALYFGTGSAGDQPKIIRSLAGGSDMYFDGSEYHFRDSVGAGESVTIRPIGIGGTGMIVRAPQTSRRALEVRGIASHSATIPILEVQDSAQNELFTTFVGGKSRINSGAELHSSTGSPEAVVTAPVSSLFMRTDGGAGTTLYVKELGTGSTGWVAK